MATTTPNTSQIPAPRVPLIDERTGLVSQQWFRWFNNIYALTGSGLGITPVANGGTGTGNIPTNGQLLIGNGTGYSLSTLTAGGGVTITNTAGHIEITSSGLSSFSAGTTGFTPSTPTTGAITLAGTLIAANGGTGYASYAVGDLLYANTTTTLAKLADVATGNALISGGVSTAPSWGKIGLTTHVSGTLPIANGGTNATATPTAGAVAYGSGTAYAFTAAGTSGQVLTSAGAGVPTWATPTTGTVTSVGLSLPAQFTVTNSPVTSSGTLTATWATQTANYVLAGPTTGAAATPTFRALVAGDIPSLSYVTSVTGTAPVVSSGGLTPAISMAAANGTTNGYLTSTDWTTFNNKGSGSVTSVAQSFTGGLISVGGSPITTSGTLALTVAGTSGGIPYFSSGTAWASSAALTQYGVVYGGGAGAAPVATAAGTTGQVLTATTGGAPTWAAPATSGTVTSVSVVSANGFAGTVATATTTPAITISTSITGLLKGNGTAISAATSGTDYAPATSGTSILYGNGSGGFSNVTVGSGLSFSAGTLASTASTASAPITKTADFTVGAGETWFINNKSGSTCTVTLPTASTNTGRELTFKNYQAQTLVSASSNVVALAGGAAATAILAASTGDWATLVSDGTNWIIMQAAANNCLLLE